MKNFFVTALTLDHSARADDVRDQKPISMVIGYYARCGAYSYARVVAAALPHYVRECE